MEKNKKIKYINHFTNDVLFITAETGYVAVGLRMCGYNVMHPYRYKTIFGRIILELMIRLHLPQKIIFNNEILCSNAKYIIVYDSIVTKEFLTWLYNEKQKAKVIYEYTNLIGKARHVFPDQIPNGIAIWTYDQNDSKKYNINLLKSGGYIVSYIGEKSKKKYDVIYIGKDKGRACYLLELQKQMKVLGLNTKFLIMPNTKLSPKKVFYSKPIEYNEIVKYVVESKAILNVTLPGQTGATMRDYESIFNEVKLITTNKYIRETDFYCPENIFILGEDKIEELPAFLNKPFAPIPIKILERHTIWTQVDEVIKQG